MLCKKCKTAVSETDTICKYCGSKISGPKNKLYAGVVAVVIIGIIAGLFLYYNREPAGVTEPPVQETHLPAPSETQAAKTPVPVKTPSLDEEPEPSYTPNFDKSEEEVQKLVKDVAEAVLEFYQQFSPYAVYVSRGGYFYLYTAGSYIKTEDLAEVAMLEPEYAGESVLILYLKPNDLQGYEQLDIKPSEKLELFAAYETRDGFVIRSANNPGGILPREDLHKVLEKYDYNHGPIRMVEYESEDYRQIMSALNRDEGIPKDVDIRYLWQDDKYAVAIVSPKDDSTNVSQYILQKSDSQWAVAISNYEVFEKHKAAINARLVDLNLEMVPRDDLTVIKKYFRGDYTNVIGAMKMNQLILDSDGAAVYQAGTHDFCYIVFESGKKFVGHLNNESVWVLYPVGSYTEAVDVMYSLQKWPPLVILRQYPA